MAVFVSYSSRDKDAVTSLTDDLKDADEQVWLDQRLAGGEAWWRAILEQIRNCDVFVFALSQNSIQSKPCQAELQYARELGLPILPIQIGPVDSMQLNPLATVQTIDYRSPTARTAMRLINALNRVRSQRASLPSPLPAEPPVPFEYLIRLFTTIAGPDQLSPRDQAALVAQLQVGLREDGDNEAARKDIVMLLEKLRDREDVTYRIRTDIDGVLASVGITASTAPDPAPTPMEAAVAERSSGDGPSPGTVGVAAERALDSLAVSTATRRSEDAADVSAPRGAPEPVPAARGADGPPTQEVSSNPAAAKVRLKRFGALTIAFAGLNLVVFLARINILEAAPWLILAVGFGLARRELITLPGAKRLAWTSGINSIVVTLASVAQMILSIAFGTYQSWVQLTESALFAVNFTSLIAFGIAARPMRRSWSVIFVVAGFIGLMMQPILLPSPHAVRVAAYIAWSALMLAAGFVLYRDEFAEQRSSSTT